MIAVKFFSKYQNKEFKRTIENISEFMKNKLFLKNIKILRGDKDSEIISGMNEPFDEENITVELIIKKTIIINKEFLDEKNEMDKYISEIKHFCKQAKEIEDLEYEVLTIRN